MLERTNPAAAAWWRENPPHAVEPGHVFGFDAEVCEPIAVRDAVPVGDGPRPEVSSQTLLEVTYVMKLGDVVGGYMEVLKRSPAARRQFAITMTIIPIGWIVLAGLVFACIHWVLALPLLALGVLHTLLCSVIYRRDAERRIRQQLKSLGTQWVSGRTTLTLTENTLTYHTETTTSIVRWRDMKGVQEAGESTHILINNLSAVVVLLRGFERGDEYDAVRDFVIAVLPRCP